MSGTGALLARAAPWLAELAIVAAAFAFLRVRALRTPAAGTTLAVSVGLAAGVVATDPRLRPAFGEPSLLMPALVLVGVFAGLRSAARRAGDAEAPIEPPSWLAAPGPAGLLAVAAAAGLALFGLGDRAVAATPSPPRPAWFLLPLAEGALDLPAPVAGWGGVTVGVALLLALPWLAAPGADGEAPPLSPRRPEVFLFLLALVALGLAPLVAGAYFRPATAVETIPFASAVGGSGWGPGVAAFVAWAALLPLWLRRGPGRPAFVRRWRDELDRRRFAATAAFLVVLGWPLVALLARALFGLSPIVGGGGP